MSHRLSAKARWSLKKKAKMYQQMSEENRRRESEIQVAEILLPENMETSSQIGDNDHLEMWDLPNIGIADTEHYILTSDDSSASSSASSSAMAESLVNEVMPGAQISMPESLHLLEAVAMKNGLTKQATEDILQLIGLHVPQQTQYPKTKYRLRKGLKFDTSWITKFFYCKECQLVLEENLSCNRCGTVFTQSKLCEEGHFFVIINMRMQIQSLLSDPLIQSSLTEHVKRLSNRQNDNCIRDITDGKCYKMLKLEKYDLTCIFNTDGVPIFNSSNLTVWPLLCSINELPFKIRKKTILMAGLWFGNSKPNFGMYLQIGVNHLNNLSLEPVTWKTLAGEKVKSKIIFPVCTVDMVARCSLQGITQFNGNYGCSFCKHPGVVVPKGRGHTRVYPYQETLHLRANESFHKRMTQNDFIEGILSKSQLVHLRFFKMVDGFIPDNMHCCYLGVTRTFLKLWLQNAGKTYYIGNRQADIDEKWLKVKVLSEIQRTTRSVVTRKNWKASEFYVFQQVAPIILKNILPAQYIAHFSCYSKAIAILSGREIREDDIKTANGLLHRFAKDVSLLYGNEYETANIHQLLHLPDYVARWGPLWATSAFQFEDYNGKVKSYVKSAKGVPLQICDKFLKDCQMRVIAGKTLQHKAAKHFFWNTLNYDTDLAPKFKLIKPKITHVGANLRAKIEQYVKFREIYDSSSAYIHHHLFKVKSTRKRSDNTVKLSETEMGIIVKLYNVTCVCDDDCECIRDFVLLNVFKVKRSSSVLNGFYSRSNVRNVPNILPLREIQAIKHFVTEIDGTIHYVELSNLVETS